jgi:hypothetical protein
MAEEAWVTLRADITDIQNKLSTLGGQSTNIANTMGINWASVATGIATSLGVAFSVRTLVNFGKASVTAFADVEVSAMVLANTLKNIGVSPAGIKSIENLINNLEQTKYFDLTAINEAFGNAVIKLRDVDLATKAVTTSMEIARAKNIPLTDAVQRLTLGLMGNSRGLRDLGINIKDYKTTLDAAGNASLDAAAQLQILNDVLVVVGGSTTTFGETTKSSLAEVTTAWHDFKVEVGSLLPVKAVASEVSGFLEGMTESLKWFADTGKRVSETHPLGNIVTPQTVQVVTDLTNGLQKVNDEIVKFKPAWATISITGINVPELTKFVGNLRNVAPIITKKTVLDINVNVNDTSKTPTAVSKAVVNAIRIGGRGAIEVGLPYVSHGTGVIGTGGGAG